MSAMRLLPAPILTISALVASLVLFVHAAWAQGEPRWALVIGNNSYQHAPTLTTPVNDAHAVADALRGLGFTVLEHENLDRSSFNDAVDTFADRILNGIAVVYYAGHGVSIRSTNYLLPIDNRARNERDVENDALPLDRMLRQFAGARAKLVVVFVDACRDNPLPPAPTKGLVSPGLAQPTTPSGTMVIFSAGTNQQALDQLPGDGPASNGLFARELLPELKRPGATLQEAVRNARTRVREEARSVGHLQNPAIYDELEGDEFYLSPPLKAHPGGDFDPRQVDLEFWSAIKNSQNFEDFQAYLERFPSGLYAYLARGRLEDLKVSAAIGHVAEPPMASPAPAEPPPAADVEAVLGLGRADWQRLQRSLAALGFDAGDIDGKPGPNTRKAVAAWQTANLEEATGYLPGPQRDLILGQARPKLDSARVEALLKLQRILTEMNHNVGKPDGNLDAATVQALEREGFRVPKESLEVDALNAINDQLEKKRLLMAQLWPRANSLLRELGHDDAVAPNGVPNRAAQEALTVFAAENGRPGLRTPDEAIISTLERAVSSTNAAVQETITTIRGEPSTMPADKIDELIQARNQMLAALDDDGAADVPEAADLAPKYYACWVERQHENLQPSDIAYCRDRFYMNLRILNDAVVPVAPEVTPFGELAPSPVVPERPKRVRLPPVERPEWQNPSTWIVEKSRGVQLPPSEYPGPNNNPPPMPSRNGA